MDAESAELEERGRNLRPIETTVIVCLNCGEEIARSSTFEWRNEPQRGPWVDPFAVGGVAAFLEHHRWFCKARRLRFGWPRRPRTTEIVVRNVP